MSFTTLFVPQYIKGPTILEIEGSTASTGSGLIQFSGGIGSTTGGSVNINSELLNINASDISFSNTSNILVQSSSLITSWSTFNSNNYNDIVYNSSLNLFCAIGNNNEILTSSNGISWTSISVGIGSKKISYSPELDLLCTLTTNNGVLLSSSATTWTYYSINIIANELVWSSELKLFCAVGPNYSYTSGDGIIWNNGISPTSVTDLTWSPKLGLFAVSTENTSIPIYLSINGLNWTSIGFNSDSIIGALEWSENLGIFVGQSSTRIITSTNGTNWTTYSNSISSFNSIKWISELEIFIGLLSSSSNLGYYSTNGITWISFSFSNTQIYREITWSPVARVYSSIGNSFIITSNSLKNNILNLGNISSNLNINGNNLNIYNSSSMFLDNLNINSNKTELDSIKIKNNNISEGIINLNSQENIVYSNIFATTWNISSTTLHNFKTIISSNGQFFAGTSSSGILYSNDGLNWTNSNATTRAEWVDITKFGNLFCAVPNTVGIPLITSSNGITWTTRSSTTSYLYTSITNSDDLVCAVGTGIIVSTEGIVWSTRTNPINTLVSVAYGEGVFVAVSSSGGIVSSSSGDEWKISGNFGFPFTSIVYSQELSGFYIFNSSTNETVYSNNGINWSTISLGNTLNTSMTWIPQLSIFCGINNGNRITIGSGSSYYSFITNTIPSGTYTSLAWDNTLSKMCVVGNNISIVNNNAYVNENIIGTIGTTDLNLIGETISIGNNGNNLSIGLFNNETIINSTTSSFLGNVSFTNTSFNENEIVIGNASLSQIQNLNTTTWVISATSQTQTLNQVAYSSELRKYVATSFIFNNTPGYIYTSSDALTWTSVSVSTNNKYYGVCWSSKLGIFCVLSDSNDSSVALSSDTITWSTYIGVTGCLWHDVAWSSDLSLFCAVAASGGSRIITSTNGKYWVPSIPPTSSLSPQYRTIVWSSELGIFCTVSTNQGTDNIATSSDGINWISRNSLSSRLDSIDWSPKLGTFLSVGRFSGIYITSPDGITWTSRLGPTSSWAVTWNAQLECFVMPSSSLPLIAISYDSINWSTISISTNVIWRSIVWNSDDSIFAVVGQGESNSGRTMTSRLQYNSNINNQVNLGTINSSETTISGKDLLLGSNSNIVNIGRYSQSLNISSKNINLENQVSFDSIPNTLISDQSLILGNNDLNTIQELSVGDNRWTLGNKSGYSISVCWSSKLRLFCAVNEQTSTTFGLDENNIQISSDGINWTYVKAPALRWRSVCWSPELEIFCAVGDTIIVSNNGTNWTETYRLYSTTIGTEYLMSVCWSPELSLFCACGSFDFGKIFTSPNGYTWTSRICPINSVWQSVAWGSGLSTFVMISLSNGNTSFQKSTDGINWTTGILPTTVGYRSVTYSPELNMFAASGDSNVITTNDAITWTTRFNNPTVNYRSICWSSQLSLFCSIRSNGTSPIISLDGINWRQINNNISVTTGRGWSGMCYSPELNRFCIVAARIESSLYTQSSMISGTEFPAINESVEIGTKAVTNSELKSNEINIGTKSSTTTLSEYSNKTTITSDQLITIDGPTKLSNSSFDYYTNTIGYDIPMNVQDLAVNTWTFVSNYSFNSITWSNKLEKFCAVGENISGLSTDGRNWTSYTYSGSWQNVLYIEDLELFVSTGVGLTGNSRDGISWTTGVGLNYGSAARLIGFTTSSASEQGWAVSISGDGNTIAVGGRNDASSLGATWIFVKSGNIWSQQGDKLVGSGVVGFQSDQGNSVGLSYDGNTVVIGGPTDGSPNKGAVWVFIRSNGIWTQQGSKLVPSDSTGIIDIGFGVSISGDGNTLAMGSVSGIWIYTRSNDVWTQQGSRLVATGYVGQVPGFVVSLSHDGDTVAVGSYADDSGVGAAWIFTRSAGVWTQQGNKLIGTGATGLAAQGRSICISGDSNTLAVGGADDNSFVGAVWIFTRSAGVWTQQGSKLVGTNNIGASQQGLSVSLSYDGNILIIGGPEDNSTRGAMWCFKRTGTNWSQLGNKFTAGTSVAGHGFSVSISNDGTTISDGAFATSSSFVFNITQQQIYSSEQSQIVYFNNNYYQTSPNGLTFTTYTFTNNFEVTGLAWSPQLSLFCGSMAAGTQSIITSPDSIVWTTRLTPNVSASCIAWSPDLNMFAVGLNPVTNSIGAITSNNGLTWTTRLNSIPMNSITWSPQLGIFCGVGNNVVTSSDGITWISRTSTTSSYQSISWSPKLGLFDIIGSSNTSIISNNNFSTLNKEIILGTGVSTINIDSKTVQFAPNARNIYLGTGDDDVFINNKNLSRKYFYQANGRALGFATSGPIIFNRNIYTNIPVWNTAGVPSSGGYSIYTVTQGGRFYPPINGLYQISFNVVFDNPSSPSPTTVSVNLRKNTSTLQSISATNNLGDSYSINDYLVYLSKQQGDFIDIYAPETSTNKIWQTTISTTAITNDNQPLTYGSLSIYLIE